MNEKKTWSEQIDKSISDGQKILNTDPFGEFMSGGGFKSLNVPEALEKFNIIDMTEKLKERHAMIYEILFTHSPLLPIRNSEQLQEIINALHFLGNSILESQVLYIIIVQALEQEKKSLST